MNENIFDKLDFGPFRSLLDNDDITDISYDNGGQIWIRSLSQGSMRVEVEGATTEFIEKLAFQCANVMGTTFNNAKPFLDAESSELRLNFVHQSIATNGIALVIRKTPAKIRLNKETLLKEDYFNEEIHNFLIKAVEAHCNILVAGETGSGKTEFVKYLASHTKTNEKIITIEDTLELHLDKIFPQRDIVAMKTNNVASYTDVLVTCMRQNPKWILLAEVRSAEGVSAVRNSISSGHNILSTIHADKASAIPYRLYSLMETDLDVNQFLNTIYRYVQLGVHIKAYYSKEYGKFHRELDEVVEFYVDEEDNMPKSRTLYKKPFGKPAITRKPSEHLIQYIENQNVDISDIIAKMPDEDKLNEENEDYDLEAAAEQAKAENEEREKQIQEHAINIDNKEETPTEQSVEEKKEETPTEQPVEENKKEEQTPEEKKEEPLQPTVELEPNMVIKAEKPVEKESKIIKLQTNVQKIEQPQVVEVKTAEVKQPEQQVQQAPAPAVQPQVQEPVQQPAAQPVVSLQPAQQQAVPVQPQVAQQTPVQPQVAQSTPVQQPVATPPVAAQQ